VHTGVDALSPGEGSAPSEIGERFGRTSTGVWREVHVESWPGPRLVMRTQTSAISKDALRSSWDQAWLRGRKPIVSIEGYHAPAKMSLRVVDLFAGCGAMSLGLRMACESLGITFAPLVSADFNASALAVYQHNLGAADVYSGDLRAAIDFQLSATTSSFTRESRLLAPQFKTVAGGVDVLIGGPPCQGHSDLNNHSRRDDPKNSLYLLMAAFAQALRPQVVIIENVPAVVHDKHGVVETTTQLLLSIGYSVEAGVMAMSRLGIAQRRRRHVLVATKSGRVNLGRLQEIFVTRERSVHWAIGDLGGRQDPLDAATLDIPSVQSKENQRRIAWLFDHDAYDLPNRWRPDCHRGRDHSYKSMYGRMRSNQSAQTITTGFGSPGQGRYIHPRDRRVITPHEAARLQYFPDSFSFQPPAAEPRRTDLARMIGNAVPPKLTYAVGLAAIASAFGNVFRRD
jgi:DNA (cytosine-5)-methyltransferase 1